MSSQLKILYFFLSTSWFLSQTDDERPCDWILATLACLENADWHSQVLGAEEEQTGRVSQKQKWSEVREENLKNLLVKESKLKTVQE